jgi:CubicO group peptidase (beta-lactamase class C family)
VTSVPEPSTDPRTIGIGGTCDPRFAPVRDAFAANFVDHGEVGAAVCITIHGEVVVDLWGGLAHPATATPWTSDTLVNAFSVGKGFVALLAAQLVDTGRLDVDLPVAHYWPEFATEGKDATTVADLLAHRAGLPSIRRRLHDDATYDWDQMTRALAAERPWWTPGTAHGYHVNTFGFLVGEVLRRITRMRPGALLRTRVAEPLGADVILGVSPADQRRVATFVWHDDVIPPDPGPDLTDEQHMQFHAYFNPTSLSGAGVINTPAWRAAEVPSTNTHATARGVARLYAALASHGSIDGVRVVGRDALAAATVVRSDGHDLVLGRPSRFGLGFQLTQPERPLGPNEGAFGHFGAGGSLGFCDPSAAVGFGYVMNQLGTRWQNPRNTALVDALYACLT